MNKYLIKLADHLDKIGFHKEADYVDWIMKNAGYDDDYNPDRGNEIRNNSDNIIAADLGISTIEAFRKLFPMGMSGQVDSKQTVKLNKQIAPYSYYADLILKVLRMNAEDKNNLKEDWCIYGVISSDKNKEEVTYDLELNTFSCNELWVYLPHAATPYAKKVQRKALGG